MAVGQHARHPPPHFDRLRIRPFVETASKPAFSRGVLQIGSLLQALLLSFNSGISREAMRKPQIWLASRQPMQGGFT